jgi:ribosomal 50S subunit-associated protein YjgA (DUF615 family)
MSPELEGLIRAYDAVTLADERQASEALQELDSLLDKVLARWPHLDRERLLRSIHHAHRRWLRAEGKPPTLPPKA